METALGFYMFFSDNFSLISPAVGFYCYSIHMGASFLCWLIIVLSGLCGHRLDRQIPMGPEAYGSCGHSMVISSKSRVESLSGQTDAQLFRLSATYWAHRAALNRVPAGQSTTPPPLHPGRKKKSKSTSDAHNPVWEAEQLFFWQLPLWNGLLSLLECLKGVLIGCCRPNEGIY